MAILTEIQEQNVAAAYDVFLSFRGIDTRLTFVDHLYQALVSENIRTFLDEEEVETGQELKPELERVIKSSRASIIVLSKNYASSTWCLDELVMILEQQKISNYVVLPIFYHVEPTHIRKQESSFGEALTVHKQRIEAEEDQEKKTQRARKFELWKKALTQVADLKGKVANGRRETLFIDEIVKEIYSRLCLYSQSNIPHLIGMDSSIYAISSWLKDKSSKTVDILTIWGMAGIGKTSLAEHIYRSHHNRFERSSFLQGIERKCAEQSSALLDLQKQLLGDILRKSTVEVHDVNVCTAKLEKALFDKQTLVVLDGIDNCEQLDALIGTKDIHPGSKIIITTKEISLVEKCALFRAAFPPKHTKHKLSCLDIPESLRLLCRSAFGGDIPKEGFEEEAERVAKYCGGHPLALKVLGSSLINEDIDTWRDIFEMMETKELHTVYDIQKVLRISFDSLPSENCKELFKHISCFFVGEDREVVESILKECGIRTSYGIAKLIDRCLLTISIDNKLMMHQLVQGMGRDLVLQESPKKPWKRSRLLNHKECIDMLKQDKGTSKVQGLALDMKVLEKEPLHGSRIVREYKLRAVAWVYEFFSRIWCLLAQLFLMCLPSQSKQIELRTNAFDKMDNLKLLQLNHIELKGSYKSFPKGLRWLCMHGFRLEYIPSELPMENLVSLDISYSNLKQLWRKPKFLRSLKILNASYSNLVRVGDFSGLPSLERLILAGCGSLIQVCESIGGCDRLVLLNLSYCKKLKVIPRSIDKLKKLKVLLVECCIGEEKASPIRSKSQTSLTSLTRCVPKNPSSFLSLPSSLVKLSLANNNLFSESFPMDFSSMPMMTILNLNDNPIHSLPDCVRNISKLKILSIERCVELKSILGLPSSLEYLFTEGCLSLEKISFRSETSRLPLILYAGAKSLNEIEGLIKFQDLAQVAEAVLCALGWTDLQDVKGQEVQVCIPPIYNHHAMRLPIQMCYEFGIFSTYFVGKEVPNWFAHRSNGSSISYTMPSPPLNKSIQGMNICFVHTCPGTWMCSLLVIKVRNMTKNRTWIYWNSVCSVAEAEDIVWLSHWMFGNKEVDDGDEFSVTIYDSMLDGEMVKECAINPVYIDSEMEEDPLSDYKLWKHRIGGDLCDHQLTSGDYYLFYGRSITLGCAIEAQDNTRKIYQAPRLSKFIGYTPQFKDLDESEIKVETHQHFFE